MASILCREKAQLVGACVIYRSFLKVIDVKWVFGKITLWASVIYKVVIFRLFSSSFVHFIKLYCYLVIGWLIFLLELTLWKLASIFTITCWLWLVFLLFHSTESRGALFDLHILRQFALHTVKIFMARFNSILLRLFARLETIHRLLGVLLAGVKSHAETLVAHRDLYLLVLLLRSFNFNIGSSLPFLYALEQVNDDLVL